MSIPPTVIDMTMPTTVSPVGGWGDILRYCDYHQPDLIYVAIGCSQKRHQYGQHSPQECPPFVRAWQTRDGHPAHVVCIFIDPDLEDDLYVLHDLTDEELTRTRIITMRCEFNWSEPIDAAFAHGLCHMVLHAPDMYLIIQDYSGQDLRRHYPIDRFGPALLDKAVFDVAYMEGGCWLDFDKVRLERDATTGAFLQPPYMPLSRAIAVASPEVIRFLAERRYYTLVSYVFGYYRHPAERDWCTPHDVVGKLREICAPAAYGVPVSVTKKNLRTLAVRMVEDFAKTAGATLSAAEIEEMIDEPTEKVLPAAVSTLRAMINDAVSVASGP